MRESLGVWPRERQDAVISTQWMVLIGVWKTRMPTEVWAERLCPQRSRLSKDSTGSWSEAVHVNLAKNPSTFCPCAEYLREAEFSKNGPTNLAGEM